MARMRMLKPEFFRDKKIRQMSPLTALVYQALWCMADDGGVAPADPERVYGELFIGWTHVTLEDTTVALSELSRSARIRLFDVGDDRYAEIVNWAKHQKPNNPSKFRYPRGGTPVTANPTVALPEPSVDTSLQLSVSQLSVNQVVKLLPATPVAGEGHPETHTNGPPWSTQAIGIYQEFVPHPIAPGRITKVLKPFVVRDGPDRVLQKWREFCKTGRHFGLEGRCWTDPPLPLTKQNPERFRDTYEVWCLPPEAPP